jgi:hypothetical protein
LADLQFGFGGSDFDERFRSAAMSLDRKIINLAGLGGESSHDQFVSAEVVAPGRDRKKEIRLLGIRANPSSIHSDSVRRPVVAQTTAGIEEVGPLV